MKQNKSKIIMFMFTLFIFFVFGLQAFAAGTYAKGDVNKDGKLTAADARIVLRAAVDLDEYSEAQLLIGDIDNDNVLTSADARLVLRASVKLENFEDASITVTSEQERNILNKKNVVLPSKGEKGTFTVACYGNGHGVGMSQYMAAYLADTGMAYDEILKYFYTGVEINDYEFPQTINYPELGEVDYVKLLGLIVKQEIGGIADISVEALKAQAVAVSTNMKYYNFEFSHRYLVGQIPSGIKSPEDFEKAAEELPNSIKTAVSETAGKYITYKGNTIQAVYGASCAGRSAASVDIWGYEHAYLQSVDCFHDKTLKGFIQEKNYTVPEMRTMIESYFSEREKEVTLSDDPAQWFEIISHSASIDENRGYVTEIRVGNESLHGTSGLFSNKMGLRSSCFVIIYNK